MRAVGARGVSGVCGGRLKVEAFEAPGRFSVDAFEAPRCLKKKNG